jgi:prepilin-type N-terminal cleavage/methylation domain-containing protein
MNRNILTNKTGATLIELLIALVLSSILVAAFYRTFIDQQKTYTVQEQVADMQQSVRVGIDQVTRQIRMAGYGLGETILASFGVSDINGFTNIFTPGNNVNNIGNNDDSITIIIAVEVAKLTETVAQGSSVLKVSNGEDFNSDKQKYLCLNGVNNYLVQSVSGNIITLATPLSEGHLIDEPVFLIKAVTYKLTSDTTNPNIPILVKNDNTGDGDQVIAENIEDLQFRYTLADGSVTDSPANPEDIRIVCANIKARTKMADTQSSSVGYRRRELTSVIKVRNLGL